MTRFDIAVLIPCYNEAASIARVVSDFRQQLPAASIYVYDNNSSDNTMEIAQAAGAIVQGRREAMRLCYLSYPGVGEKDHRSPHDS